MTVPPVPAALVQGAPVMLPLQRDRGTVADCRATPFRASNGEEFVYLEVKRFDGTRVPYVRVHSGCLTGDVFGSLRCDCGMQLDAAIDLIAEAGSGGLLYLPSHEGRGIGLFDKLRSYELQEQGLDTYDANRELGYGDDMRDFTLATMALRLLGITRVVLITNNPDKVAAMEAGGVEVVRRQPLLTPASAYNLRYLRAKRDRRFHLLDGLDAMLSDAMSPDDVGT